MLTSLITPAQYKKDFEKMRQSIQAGNCNIEHIVKSFILLFRDGLVAEMRKLSSIDVVAEFILTIKPNDEELARLMRECLFIATERYSSTYFITKTDAEDVRSWRGYLANALHYGNLDQDRTITDLCNRIKPTDWNLKKYGEHDYGSLARRLQEAYRKEEPTF